MRPPRLDSPGSLHHVMNRAVGRRPMFETDDDIRRFLDCVGDVVADGGLAVHAYSILTTHWHLGVGSPLGEMSESLRILQGRYSSAFNRRRDRPGPLVRGRYRSKRIDSDGYFRNLIRYIDANPIEAGLVIRASEYPFGSAWAYELGGGPAWLDKRPVERLAMRMRGCVSFDGELYRSCFGPRPTRAESAHLERSLWCSNRQRLAMGPFAAAHPIVQARLQEQALVADGVRVGCPVVDRDTVDAVIAAARRDFGPWVPEGKRRCVWDLARYAWLHDLSGQTQEEIAGKMGKSRSTIRDGILAYRAALLDPRFADRVRDLLARFPAETRIRHG